MPKKKPMKPKKRARRSPAAITEFAKSLKKSLEENRRLDVVGVPVTSIAGKATVEHIVATADAQVGDARLLDHRTVSPRSASVDLTGDRINPNCTVPGAYSRVLV